MMHEPCNREELEYIHFFVGRRKGEERELKSLVHRPLFSIGGKSSVIIGTGNYKL